MLPECRGIKCVSEIYLLSTELHGFEKKKKKMIHDTNLSRVKNIFVQCILTMRFITCEDKHIVNFIKNSLMIS